MGVLKFLGDRYQVPEDQRFLNYRDLTATDVDAVFVLNGGDHTPQILDALQAKKHVFVEKPMCYTFPEKNTVTPTWLAQGSVRVAFDSTLTYVPLILSGMIGGSCVGVKVGIGVTVTVGMIVTVDIGVSVHVGDKVGVGE
jgi:hypothetical protein